MAEKCNMYKLEVSKQTGLPTLMSMARSELSLGIDTEGTSISCISRITQHQTYRHWPFLAEYIAFQSIRIPESPLTIHRFSPKKPAVRRPSKKHHLNRQWSFESSQQAMNDAQVHGTQVSNTGPTKGHESGPSWFSTGSLHFRVPMWGVAFWGGMFVKQDQPGFNTRQMWILTRLTRRKYSNFWNNHPNLF